MDKQLVSYYAGISIIFGTHLWIILSNKNSALNQHAYINLFGAMLIAFYFLKKEKFI